MSVSDIPNRLKTIIDYRYPKRGAYPQLEAQTGISKAAWGHIYTGRNRPGIDTLEAICKLFPQYTLWLMTGQTNEAAGQTSPEIEQLRELEKKVAGK